MPASPVVGMLACWHAGRWPASEGGGEKCWHVCAVGMHPSMPAPPVVGMLACWDANQQHRQTSMTTTEALAEVAWPWLWMLVCTPAPSTQHPAILGYNHGCWPCGHARYFLSRRKFELASATCQNAGNQDLPFRSWSTSSPGGKSEVPAMSSGDAPELNLPNVDFPPRRLQV